MQSRSQLGTLWSDLMSLCFCGFLGPSTSVGTKIWQVGLSYLSTASGFLTAGPELHQKRLQCNLQAGQAPGSLRLQLFGVVREPPVKQNRWKELPALFHLPPQTSESGPHCFISRKCGLKLCVVEPGHTLKLTPRGGVPRCHMSPGKWPLLACFFVP